MMKNLMSTPTFPRTSIFNSKLPQRSGRRVSDIEETDEAYNWRVDMPGVGRDNINVEYDGQSQTVTVSTSYEDTGEDVRRRRSYSRTVKVGDAVDPARITASYENGVLMVNFPKSEEEQVTRQIEIE